nr:MAG TPA: hypothetical protein [Bacteriophage sp.]
MVVNHLQRIPFSIFFLSSILFLKRDVSFFTTIIKGLLGIFYFI